MAVVTMPEVAEVAAKLAAALGKGDDVDEEMTDLATKAIEQCARLAASAFETIPPYTLMAGLVASAKDDYYGRRAQNGIVTFGGGDVGIETVRINRDPLAGARAEWRQYLPLALA